MTIRIAWAFLPNHPQIFSIDTPTYKWAITTAVYNNFVVHVYTCYVKTLYTIHSFV